MKIFADINDLSSIELGESLFDQLSAIFPQMVTTGRTGRMLRIKIPIEDSRLMTAQSILYAAGFTPRGLNGSKSYPLEFLNEFERSDYESVQYLQPCPSGDSWFGQYTLDSAGRVCVQSDKGGNRLGMGKAIVGLAAEAQHLLVTSKVQRILEDAKLDHLVFREAVLWNLDDEPMQWPGEPYWELTSDLAFPPPIPKPLLRWDDPRPREEHFRRSDVDDVPRFGLALAPNTPMSQNRFLIASKDFYNVCVAYNLQIDWIPIHVDD